MHETDPVTPKGMTPRRADEISEWLEDHPDTTRWVAFDDLPTPEPGGILIDLPDGILLEHYALALRILDVVDPAWA